MSKFTLTKDLIVPAGTKFDVAANKRGGNGYVEAVVGFGKDFSGNLVVQVNDDMINSDHFMHHCTFGSSSRIGYSGSCVRLECNVCGDQWEKDVS